MLTQVYLVLLTTYYFLFTERLDAFKDPVLVLINKIIWVSNWVFDDLIENITLKVKSNLG